MSNLEIPKFEIIQEGRSFFTCIDGVHASIEELNDYFSLLHENAALIKYAPVMLKLLARMVETFDGDRVDIISNLEPVESLLEAIKNETK